jgi:hypothetical protein
MKVSCVPSVPCVIVPRPVDTGPCIEAYCSLQYQPVATFIADLATSKRHYPFLVRQSLWAADGYCSGLPFYVSSGMPGKRLRALKRVDPWDSSTLIHSSAHSEFFDRVRRIAKPGCHWTRRC